MANILWLDDSVEQRRAEVDALRGRGHILSVCRSDREAIDLIQTGYRPDLVIQDLHRPPDSSQFDSLPSRPFSTDSHKSGWSFYADVLKLVLPQVPVIIYSVDAETVENRKQAEDFNLMIIRKGKRNSAKLVDAADSALIAQNRVVSWTGEIPHIITVDFGKVNAALIRHLAVHPTSLHQVSWSSFEELIGRLLTEMGYAVRRTRLTRDGGVDIWALKKTELGEVLYAIDAKKYAPNTILGPEPVRAIHGVADAERASVGMIVTTANFGPSAKVLAQQLRYQISLKEFDDVIEWIRRVDGHGSAQV
jgi:CheY-like chemotaxis protein